MEASSGSRRHRPNATRDIKNSCRTKSLGCGEVSKSNFSTKSLLRGNIRSLAIGTLGGKNNLEDSVAEVTVSLSKSSLYSNSSLTTRNTTIDAASECSDESFSGFVDTFQHLPDQETSFLDPYLDNSRRRPVKPEPDIPQYNIVEDSLEDYITACCSEEHQQDGCQGVSPPEAKSLNSAFPPTTLRIPTRLVYARDEQLSTSSQTTMASYQRERMQRARQEQRYWNSVVSRRTMTLGALNRQTAEAMFSLGHTYMRLNEYREAMGVFKSTGKIFKALDGPTHLSVGRALDAYGLAILRYQRAGSKLISAKKALDDAFSIRFHNLGIWHVDTVETYNKIASVYLHMGDLQDACKAYEEVYLVRKAIFGTNHPSVAISAHGLANVCLKMRDPQEAVRYFDIALRVYQSMHLSMEHPTVIRLLMDMKRLESVSTPLCY